MLFARPSIRPALTLGALALLLSGVFRLPALPLETSLQTQPVPPEVMAESAILLDATTGTVLYEKNADAEWPPASLTKLFTLHMVYRRIEQGAVRLGDKVGITPEAWAARMPGSSLMFLEPGQRVTVAELMKGLAVCSGNDAAVALARHCAGSVAAFVAEMNQEAKRLGFSRMRFVDPSGLSGRNRVTAREFARFCVQYVRMHPQSLEDLHSVPEMSYPLARNMPPRRPVSTNTIHQYNQNALLMLYEGVDGLKTGFIEESGYNYALTARRGDMRLVAVSLGGPGRSDAEGSRTRSRDGAALLSFGFDNFLDVRPPLPALGPLRVWKSRRRALEVEPLDTPVLTVPRIHLASLARTVRLPASVTAPIARGERVGEIVFFAGETEVGRTALVAAVDAPRGGPFLCLWDGVRLFFRSLFAAEKPYEQHAPVHAPPLL